MPLASRRGWVAAALVLTAALASALLPYSPVYDPWAWLVWGRELVEGGLDTSGGPSFKPLPVALCALLAPLGEAAPDAWLVIARAGWLAAPLLGAWLVLALAEERSAAAWAGAALAAGSIALMADPFTPSARQFAGGLSEPVLVALVLGAVAAELRGRTAPALVFAFLAALIRPEAWPFALAYGVVAARRDPGLRPAVVVGALAVPACWFLPDLLSTGDATTGAGVAREGSGSPPVEALEVLGRALAAPLAAVWAGVALLLAAGRRGAGTQRPERILLAGGLAWIGVVAAMAALGYAGLPRFFAPATAVISVLGGVGVARALAGRRRGAAALVAAAALVIGAAGLGLRAAEVPGDLESAAAYSRSVDDVFALEERAGRDTLLECRERTTVSDLLVETALAWRLDVALSDIGSRLRPRRGVVVVPASRAVRGERVARAGEWAAVRQRC